MLQLETIIDKLNLLFSMGEYETAEKLIQSTRAVPDLYNDTVAIFDANLCLSKSDYPQMWTAIKRGLTVNPKNYELYVMLGEYYLPTNPNQAYLCFEQALFYCNNEADKNQIQGFMDTLKQENNITVNNVSFVILSYNTLDFTKTCIESIRENTMESSREIVIVDNASTDGSLEWLKEQNDIVLRANKENSGFPKGCNQGVEVAAKENDIFLLNNDTLLPPNALFWLRMGLYENDTVGSTGSITNFASNLQARSISDTSTENLLNFAQITNIPTEYPYEEKIYLVGFALLIKRSVWDVVGELDERFSPGNYEDNDYGLRILMAGYKNILCHNSFILHFGSKSFGKKAKAFQQLLSTNAKKFEDKWNIHSSNLYLNPELMNVIHEERSSALNILVVGCKCGAMCMHLKHLYPNALIHGIEKNTETAKIAQNTTRIQEISIENMKLNEINTYDYILIEESFGIYDNANKALENLYPALKRNGHLIFSAPNVKHYSIMLPLMFNDVFNPTQKLYSRSSLIQLLEHNKYKVETINLIQSLKPSQDIEKLIDSITLLVSPNEKDIYLTTKYIIKSTK